ncbi:TPA: fimbria/pilus periplasmic chaperone [Escherichia coli]|nr:fimbria/pilus periplasmic chaperone [Escherichia coli]
MTKEKIIICFYFFISVFFSIEKAIAETPIEYPYPETKKIQLHTSAVNLLKGALEINNPGDKAWLVQAWTEDKKMKRSHFIYPAIARVEPRNKLILNVVLIEGKYDVKPNSAFVIFFPSGKGINELVVPVAYRLGFEFVD